MCVCVCVCLNMICLLWCDGISTIDGHLMPNPFYSYISDI